MGKVSSSNSQGVRVPKLRFPGFEGEWKVYRLSDFTKRVMRKNTNNESDLPLTISSKDGLVDQISYFNKTVASKDMSGYYLLMQGEFAYNKSYSVGYDFGSIKRLDRYPKGALSTLYICFELTQNDSDFMKVYFDSLKWYKEIYMIAAEGARNHGLLNVPTDDFFDTKHTLPADIREQQKIAQFMILLEKRIEKQRQLVEALKSYKRGLSTALFTRRIRIADAGESQLPEWKKRSLGEVFSERTERARGDEKLLAVTINNGVQDRETLELKDNSSEDKTNYKVVHIGDLAYNSMRMWQGACGVSSYDGIVSPAYTVVFVVDPEMDYALFWGYYFKEISMLHTFQRNSQGLTSDTWNLKYDKFSKIIVNAPCLEEQVRIASLIDHVSNAITVNEEVLDRLLNYKRGLLADMFI